MKGTEKRARLLPSEYEAKLRAYDVRFHGAAPHERGQPAPPPGPLVRRLQGYELLKLVAGPWGDVSQDLHSLLRTFAEQRVEILARSAGLVHFCMEGELGKVMGEVRRAFSVNVVRSNALCLLERLSQLYPGAKRAWERRRVDGTGT